MKFRLIACVTVLSVLFFSACKKSDSFTISGTITNAGKVPKVFLLQADSTEVKIIDSTGLDSKNEFKFTHNAPYANLYKIKVGDNIFDFVVQNGDDIKMSTNLADPSHAYEVSGSETSERIKEFNKISNFYGEKNSKLSDEYAKKSEALGHQSDSLLAVFMPVFQKNLDENSREILKFMDRNKKSLAAFYAATSLDQIKYEKQLVAYADEIKNDFTDNPGVRTFVRQMAIAKPVSIGHKAPEFTIAGIDGKQIKLSDYKGKYVMLDFWASWCAPCRRENPNVVKQYAKFNAKGFNILGISLDEDKTAWQKAIRDDKITWAQASEQQRFEGATETLYHVEAIPSNYIIDPQGNIIAKNITGADLEAFLNKTFN